MVFCSWPFVQFFVVVFAVYWLAPWHRLRLTVALPWRGGAARPAFVLTGDEGRVWWLLAASFYFYASWNKWLALLIVASTLVDYGIGRGLEALQSNQLRRSLLLFSLAANLGLLGYFKYSNFFLASLYDAFGFWHDPSRPLLDILVPVGISFYTFEAINYIVEVYWRRVPAERNPAHLLFFVMFFPHLLAGPIVRARDFLPQIRRRKRWSWGRCQAGVELFLLGLVKKWVVADQLALYSDPVFAAPGVFGTAANWAALLAFTVQLYCDISGYADMALGTAHLLGYKLAQNFNMPYLATSVADYWRRNHISLSTWLRDYLFLPLMSTGRGGRWQSGRWLTCRNLLITMTLGGLWHGASWNFVLWGLLHGILLSIHHLFPPAPGRAAADRPGDGLAHGPDVLLHLPGLHPVPLADVPHGRGHVRAPVAAGRGARRLPPPGLSLPGGPRGRRCPVPCRRLPALVGKTQPASAHAGGERRLHPGALAVHGAGPRPGNAFSVLPVLGAVNDERDPSSPLSRGRAAASRIA